MDMTKRIKKKKKGRRRINSKERNIATEREEISIGELITVGMQGKNVRKRIERKINKRT